MHRHPYLTRDVTRCLVEERVERPLQRREPQAVVDELGPALLDAVLEPCEVTFDGDVLELLVRSDQGDRAGALVDLAALDADEAVLHHVEPADAVGACATVELLDHLEHRHRATVDGRRDAVDEPDDDLVRVPGCCRVLRIAVEVLDRTVPDVLEEAGLHGTTPDVLVDGVRRLLRHVDRQALLLGESDRLVAGHT